MEADGLRWSLLIIGSLVIVGLAVHGIWLSRKNTEKKTKTNTSKHKSDQEYQPSGWQSDTDRFDEEVNYGNNDTDEDLDIKFDIGEDDVASDKGVSDKAEATSTTNEFDDLGLGAVRVVSSAEKVDEVSEQTPAANTPVEPDVASSKIYAI
jgi:cell division protein ZipA